MAVIQSSHWVVMAVAVVVASAAGSDNSSARSRWLAVVTRCRPCDSLRPQVWWHTVTHGSSQRQWCMSLSTAVLLAATDARYKQLQWTLAKQCQPSKLWRWVLLSYWVVRTSCNGWLYLSIWL